MVKKIQRALKNNGYYLSYNGRYLMVDGKYEIYTGNGSKRVPKRPWTQGKRSCGL